RLAARRIATLKDGDDMGGNRTRVKVGKNKPAPPFKHAEVDITYGQGKENARQFLRDNPDLAAEIEKKIKDGLGIGVDPNAAPVVGEDLSAAEF
ncbi:MAG: DNA recombination/repair protein RecA, partial [Aeromicrobium sp.]